MHFVGFFVFIIENARSKKNLYILPTEYSYVSILYRSEKNVELFPFTELTNLFL